ncbi:MAG: F0F1 ATP synthase subunit A [Clostridiales bacterium]|nr:F0F1 ATP synthase subunit A [Clostridiales bacterium]
MNGPKLIFQLPFGINITETVFLSWCIIVAVALLLLYLTHDMEKVPTKKRQVIAEWIVETMNNLVKENMGEKFMGFAPYIAGLFTYSILGSLIGLIGLRPVTADINTTATWAVTTALMVQIVKVRTSGFGGYLKGFAEPVAAITPLNIISEFSTPVSMAFRHFGNIAAGMVISSLIYMGLASLSAAIHLPIPLLQVGLPAILSLYFDIFSGFMQAYIFCMLTMVFISSAAE